MYRTKWTNEEIEIKNPKVAEKLLKRGLIVKEGKTVKEEKAVISTKEEKKVVNTKKPKK